MEEIGEEGREAGSPALRVLKLSFISLTYSFIYDMLLLYSFICLTYPFLCVPTIPRQKSLPLRSLNSIGPLVSTKSWIPKTKSEKP